MTTREFDLLIVGGGPAGLSAAICGASEGLSSILIDSGPTLGGQAVNSSSIENYPGFPDGIKGNDLMGHFIRQARKFSTEIMCPAKAVGIRDAGARKFVMTEDGEEICARMVILTAGLSYRQLNAKGIGALMGRGVQYGAPTSDPQTLGDCKICIVGGANSAGQAAMHLSTNPGAHVKLLIRKGLEDQMSTYLVERIRAKPNIEVCEGVEVIEVSGNESLDTVVLKNIKDGSEEGIPANHLFIFIGANPKTYWLKGLVAMDERNFILTNSHLPPDLWTLPRSPLNYETSMPGVFCAGDVRLGSTKRIGAAVGEGMMALQMCHAYNHLLESA